MQIDGKKYTSNQVEWRLMLIQVCKLNKRSDYVFNPRACSCEINYEKSN